MKTPILLTTSLLGSAAMSGAQAPAPAAPAAASDNQPAAAAPAAAPDMQPVAAPSDKQPAAAPAKCRCRGQVLRQWASNGQRSCLIVFPSPVIREDQVGSDAGDAVIVDKGGRVRALWQNRTTLVVAFDVPSAPDVATVSLRPGLRGTKGEELVIEPQRFCGEGLYDLVCIKEPGPGQPVFLYTRDGSDERIAMLDRAMGSLRCLSTGKDGHELPVKLRRATRRDVLRYWSLLKEDCYGLNEGDKALFAEGPPDEPLRGLWYLELPSEATDVCQIVIPGFGSPNAAGTRYEDVERLVSRCCSPYVFLSNKRLGPCEYEVELQLAPGVDLSDPEALMSRFKWKVHEMKHAKDPVPMVYRDGAFRAMIRGKELVLRLDAEASRAYLREQPQADGSTKTLCTRLIWKMNNGNRHVMLTLESAGDEGSKVLGSFWTAVQPREPQLQAHASFGTLSPGKDGEPKLSCRAKNAENLRVHVCRLDASASNAARVLRAYRNYYGPERDSSLPGTNASRLADSRGAMTIVATELLPGVLGEASKALTTTFGRADVSLRELFPDAGRHGLYFVEFEADAASDGGLDDKGGKVLTQGLVQLTDLGLMWKSWKGHVLVYAYRLSDGRPLREGTLRLLSADGSQLEEHAVRDGVVELETSCKPSFLQLSCGDDSYITEFSRLQDNDYEAMPDVQYFGHFEINEMLDSAKLRENPLPVTQIYTFTDRDAYRPGEVAHLKGYVRDKRGNELRVPKLRSVTAILDREGEAKEIPARLEGNGAFSLDIPVDAPNGSYLSVKLQARYEGDEDNSSELMRLAADYVKNPADVKAVRELLLEYARHGWESLRVTEFRRNEFEVESSMKVDESQRKVTIDGRAVNFSTTPVAGGKAEWQLDCRQSHFCPAGYRHYRFGDYGYGASEADFYRAYYGIDTWSMPSGQTMSSDTLLDDEGCGRMSFTLPASDQRRVLTSSLTVTNGNKQSLRATCHDELHPADVYVGLREGSRIVRVGEGIPVNCLLVDTEGHPWKGEALKGSITVTRKSFSPYRIGNRFLGQVRQVPMEEKLIDAQPITLSGTEKAQPDLVVETPRSGIYEVTVSGSDAAGRPFRTVMSYSVYGDGQCPWYYDRADNLNLTADKSMYKPGEKARLLFEGPAGGELFITVEREGVLRYFSSRIDPANPVIELPLEASDAPGVRVTAFLVQGANETRSENGTANILSASTMLHVEPSQDMLSVSLQAPEQSLLPDEDCKVSGKVCDADGAPVPGADVTLYAVDEGTLQVHGYNLPDPLRFFSSDVHVAVSTRNSANQLIGEALSLYDYGNKGVFIGGGDGMAADMSDDAPLPKVKLRENFTPCALWLGSIRTDEKGEFSAAFRNPDTLTRYRLMAVASSGVRQFGRARSSYEVNQPVMLEPQVPMAATEGDRLDLPVTLSMLPEQVKGLDPNATVRFRLTAQGQGLSLDEAARTVDLTGNKPVTVTLPVSLPKVGKGAEAEQASITWSVEPVDAQGTLPDGAAKRMRDSVKLSFPINPARPRLREYICTTMKPGDTMGTRRFVTLNFSPGVPLKLSFSTHPLAPISGTFDFLFRYPHGCSEQLSSALLPWLLAGELKDLPGFSLPKGKTPARVIGESLSQLRERASYGYGKPSGFAYWDRGGISAEFTPYVQLVLQIAEKHGYGEHWYATSIRNSMKQQLRDRGKANLISVLPLALSGSFSSNDLTELLQVHTHMREDALWLTACAAAIIKDERAAELAARAEAARVSPEVKRDKVLTVEQYRLTVPCDILRLLFRHYSNPADKELITDACAVLRERSGGCLSTWESGWSCILIDALLDHRRHLCDQKPGESAKGEDSAPITLNGEAIKPRELLHRTVPLDLSSQVFTAEGGTIYAFGTAEGYQADAQPDLPIDHGFLTIRSYEVLQADGSWKATQKLRVGDVVRITVTCRHTGSDRARYVAIEDRLPSVMEVVDPNSPTQSLAPSVARLVQPSGWYASSSVSKIAIGKDGINAYVNSWKGDACVRYVARVVRSGEVTAPAARAEMMYSPQSYGLSTPEKLSVEPAE